MLLPLDLGMGFLNFVLIPLLRLIEHGPTIEVSKIKIIIEGFADV